MQASDSNRIIKQPVDPHRLDPYRERQIVRLVYSFAHVISEVVGVHIGATVRRRGYDRLVLRLMNLQRLLVDHLYRLERTFPQVLLEAHVH